MPSHVIQQGECIETLARRAAIPVDEIWNHADNRDLRELRRTPYVLFPGDVVQIPERAPDELSAATGQVHRFRGRTSRLRLLFKLNGRVVGDEPYRIEIGSFTREAKTGGDGTISIRIPTHATEGTLRLPRLGEVFALRIGQIDPVDTLTGAQARLAQLGYYPGRVDGDEGPFSQAALLDFQKDHDLEASGQLDSATADKLREVYGF